MGLRAWVQLSLTDGIGPVLAARLIDACGSAESACAADTRVLSSIQGIGTNRASRIRSALAAAANSIDTELQLAESAGAKLLCRDDPDYPPLLAGIPDPPLVLYMRGSFEPRDLYGVGIVGSRRCSHYGREQADRFSALLAGSGVTVMSGGARGIDTAAHRGALRHPHGRTITVLGCGIDIAYPPENADLFKLVAERGAVISEFAMGTPPNAENFPRRNRIISGLSRGVLVIEADERSGALITARQAIDDHQRPVFCLPGRVDNAMSAGPHALIRDGAVLVRNLQDILDELPPLPDALTEDSGQLQLPLGDANVHDPAVGVSEPSYGAIETSRQASPAIPVGSPPDGNAVPGGGSTSPIDTGPPSRSARTAPGSPNLSPDQVTLLAAVGDEPAGVDALVERSGLPAGTVLRELMLLSLRGAVRRVDGQSYILARRKP